MNHYRIQYTALFGSHEYIGNLKMKRIETYTLGAENPSFIIVYLSKMVILSFQASLAEGSL